MLFKSFLNLVLSKLFSVFFVLFETYFVQAVYQQSQAVLLSNQAVCQWIAKMYCSADQAVSQWIARCVAQQSSCLSAGSKLCCSAVIFAVSIAISVEVNLNRD